MRRGYTLVEMLIVVTIMIILVAAAIPLAKKLADGGKTRESSRQLSAFFATARARALSTNRPCGVEFVCVAPLGDTSGARQSTQLFLAEVPPPYSGGTTFARANFRVENGLSQFLPMVPVNYIDANRDGRWDDDANGDGIPDPSDLDSDHRVDVDTGEMALLLSLINPGELFSVQQDHKGPWFVCKRNQANQLVYSGTTTMGMSASILPTHVNHFAFPGLPYSIRRSPRRVGNGLELTSGAAIDLSYSGIADSGMELSSATKSVTVMLSPNGGIDTLYVDGVSVRLLGSVHFLTGRVEKIASPVAPAWSDTALSNIADPESIWVSLGFKTGIAMSAENLPDKSQAANGLPAYIKAARQAAINRQQMGGR